MDQTVKLAKRPAHSAAGYSAKMSTLTEDLFLFCPRLISVAGSSKKRFGRKYVA
jgi:hypothetical protein